ncbi:MAG: hypothetical protein CMJ81_19345 [Planctomycetaceae bacterium]|nr:hypothetical protein [Planctomycetaceae bacterium]MBP63914.1 hypothetical protein [Planctomycetaceae bacterium]
MAIPVKWQGLGKPEVLLPQRRVRPGPCYTIDRCHTTGTYKECFSKRSPLDCGSNLKLGDGPFTAILQGHFPTVSMVATNSQKHKNQ